MTDKQNQETGKRIKHFREKAHLTQVQLGEKADIHPNTVARLERGKHEISNDTLKKLVKALSITSKDILGY